MSDRIDPSQYPEAYDFREAVGFDGPDGVQDVQYTDPDPRIATVEELTNYRHPSQIPLPEVQYPALVTTIEPVRQRLRYRTVNGSAVVVFGKARFAGINLADTSGAGAYVRIRDGVDTQGSVVVPVRLAPNESARDYLPTGSPVVLNNGLYVEVVSGTVEGTVLIVEDYRA